MLHNISPNEIALVVTLLLFVLVAPKVPRIGERIGGWWERRRRDDQAGKS